MAERERDTQDDIDARTLRAMRRRPMVERVEALEEDAIDCAHDRDRLSGALDRNTRALEANGERIAAAIERPRSKPWSAHQWAAFFGGLALLIGAIGAQIAMFLKR